MRERKVIRYAAILSCCLVVLAGGCKAQNTSPKKVRDLDFTVVEEKDVPQELKNAMDEKAQKPYKLTYTDDQFLYIAVGYGEQRTGGYSITVDNLYLTKNAVYIGTNLIGPGKDEMVSQAVTYPYIVVKTEALDVSVVFE